MEDIDIKSAILLIKKDLDYLKKFIEEDRKKYDEHIQSADSFREKVIKHESQLSAIASELLLVKWMLGIIITVGLALLGKLLNIF